MTGAVLGQTFASETLRTSVVSPSTRAVGFWSAVLATAFSLTYVVGQIAEWLGWLGSAGGPESSSTPLGIVVLLTPSLFLGSAFLVLLVSVHQIASSERRVWSLAALAFGIAYAVLISMNYFVQLTLVAPRLGARRHEGDRGVPLRAVRLIPVRGRHPRLQLHERRDAVRGAGIHGRRAPSDRAVVPDGERAAAPVPRVPDVLPPADLARCAVGGDVPGVDVGAGRSLPTRDGAMKRGHECEEHAQRPLRA
jgi:hypothetical protein